MYLCESNAWERPSVAPTNLFRGDNERTVEISTWRQCFFNETNKDSVSKYDYLKHSDLIIHLAQVLVVGASKCTGLKRPNSSTPTPVPGLQLRDAGIKSALCQTLNPP